MKIFLAMPQYRPLPEQRELELADLFEMEGWKPMGLHPRVASSILNLKKTKHQYVLMISRYDGLIERSECSLLSEWLELWNNGDKYDYFLRLDEDIEFHPSAIQSMIDADKSIIGAPYAYKTDNGIKARKSVCKYLPSEVPDENGILRVLWLNGGFQLFRSDALFKLMEAYPDLKYDRIIESGPEFNKDGNDQFMDSYALFTCMIKQLPSGRRLLLSEDYAICQRAIDVGMDVYLDTKVQLCHWDGHIGYMMGKEPFVVTKENKPWEQKTTERTTLSAV